MKTNLLICGYIIFQLARVATATTILDANWTVGTAIPVGSPVGITVSQTFQNLNSSPIASVTVDLNINGGYNGGLYGYLNLQDANGNVVTEILLNRMGTSPSNPFGSSGSGLDITLSDSGTANGSIHWATGMPTGIWQPDSADTLNETFGGMTANGTWTLFLADLYAGGGTGTLESWGLEITAVPEPGYGGLVGIFVLVGLAWRLRRIVIV